MEATIPGEKLGLDFEDRVVHIPGVHGNGLFYGMLAPTGLLIAGAMGTFLAAAVANAITVRIFERGRLSMVGLGWDDRSLRNMMFGVSAGILAAAVYVGPALLLRVATVEADPEYPANLSSLVFVTCILVFGAFGEELLFRGMLSDHGTRERSVRGAASV